MVANALMLTIAIVLGLGFWFMQKLTYFISYKSVLFRFYGTPILIYCAVLFINVFALAFAPLRAVTRDHILGFIVLDDAMIDRIMEASWDGVRR